MRNSDRIGILILMALAVCAPAFAQDADIPNVRSGDMVWAVKADGTTIRGKVTAISATGLNLKSGSTETSLPLQDLRRIEGRDSLKNGAIIGAIPTSLLFGAAFAAVSSVDCFYQQDCSEPSNGPAVIGLVVGAGIGAALGAGIDRMIPGRRVLYRGPASATSVSVAPMASPRGAGIRLSMRW